MIEQADVIEWAASYQGDPFHALLCDPPYDLTSPVSRSGSRPDDALSENKYNRFNQGGFMGKTWDGTGIAFRPETWKALAVHLHPGAFLFAFGGCRTYHRMATAMEDAGLILHPALCWSFGSGFPKATRIDNQVDREAGEEQPVVGATRDVDGRSRRAEPRGAVPRASGSMVGGLRKSGGLEAVPVTPLARTWAGHRYGLQCIKPAVELIAVAQVPYQGRPVDCITRTGAGAVNIEAGRIGTETRLNASGPRHSRVIFSTGMTAGTQAEERNYGRWPSNLILSEETAGALDAQSGETRSQGGQFSGANAFGQDSGWNAHQNRPTAISRPDDFGGASRFFFHSDWTAERLEAEDPIRYHAKAGREERDAGLERHPLHDKADQSNWAGRCRVCECRMMLHGKTTCGHDDMEWVPTKPVRNPHPCCKPIRLCRYLATLLLPPAEYAPRRLLIPFAGSGSEMIGAYLAGWEEILGIEAEAEYCEIARSRLAWWQGHAGLFEQVTAEDDAPSLPLPAAPPAPTQMGQRGLDFTTGDDDV